MIHFSFAFTFAKYLTINKKKYLFPIFFDEITRAMHSSDDENSAVQHKKRHHKKSKKVKKHKSRKKETSSESDSEDSSSDSSSEEEVAKRKKQKKHKKSKRHHRHNDDDDDDAVAIDNSGDDIVDVKVSKESQKIHYVSSGEDERHHRGTKRVDEGKKPRGSLFEEKEIKSKWDSPTEDYERKR